MKMDNYKYDIPHEIKEEVENQFQQLFDKAVSAFIEEIKCDTDELYTMVDFTGQANPIVAVYLAGKKVCSEEYTWGQMFDGPTGSWPVGDDHHRPICLGIADNLEKIAAQIRLAVQEYER